MPRKKKNLNIIFLGRKVGAVEAVQHLLKSGASVKLIVAPREEDYKPTLRELARKHKIPFLYDDTKLYNLIKNRKSLILDTDLVISYLYWRKIKQPLFNLPKLGCINFHPAPLPDYKGRAGYNTAILNQSKFFGASAHFIDSEEFDVGPIIKVKRFPINSENETAFSLEAKTQTELLALFKEVMADFLVGKKIKTKPNKEGIYWSGKYLEEAKKINLDQDSVADIDRKIRAFFFPPYSGAWVEIGGKKFTLINDQILNLIKKIIDDRKNK
ncbi:MAG: formyltransferase family protein [Patescibacteria group bacterium]|jgi:methionyl-tRNA formyltransferase